MSPARVALPAVAVLLFALPAAAQQPPAPLDAEADRPYLWRVVVQARPHPVVTADLRARLRQELRDTLQAGLGPLGTAEVIDLDALPRTQWEPLWQQFDDKGFTALDAPREVSGVKTHFLRLEYRDGVFHLEARQH
ncbi:MAG TPA: hypothetical protein VKE74_09745, partial [Gemmataceae bacterium]|nr:hypothetical protein [Gemmataceae bacterium]